MMVFEALKFEQFLFVFVFENLNDVFIEDTL